MHQEEDSSLTFAVDLSSEVSDPKIVLIVGGIGLFLNVVIVAFLHGKYQSQLGVELSID